MELPDYDAWKLRTPEEEYPHLREEAEEERGLREDEEAWEADRRLDELEYDRFVDMIERAK